MKKIFCALLALILVLTAGCGSKSNEPSRQEIEINGVTFSKTVKKAVSLSPSVTETLYILGFGGRVAGVSDFCVIPKGGEKPARCGSALLADVDKIIKLSPDVVFSSAQLPRSALEQLEAAKIKAVVISPAESVDGIVKNCRLLSSAFVGNEKAELMAKQLELFFDTTLDYIADSISGEIVSGETTALYLRKTPLVVATGDSLENELLKRIGFSNPAEEYEDWYYPADSTDKLSPEYIFVDKSIQKSAMLKSDFYAASPAVELERVYRVDSAIFERRSPRLFFELERVMKEAFPDAFDEPKPSFVMEMEQPPEPEKSWWEKLFD